MEYKLITCQGETVGVVHSELDMIQAAREHFDDPDLIIQSYGDCEYLMSNGAVLCSEPVHLYENNSMKIRMLQCCYQQLREFTENLHVYGKADVFSFKEIEEALL